jgi:iron complex outermembrane recepter protein
MKKLFGLMAGACIALAGQAQTGTKVTGNIKDGGNQKVIEAATIALLRAKDSATVKLTYSEKSGQFQFEDIKAGNYLVMATSVGHAKTYSPAFALAAGAEINVGTLQLVPQEKNLKGVTVVAKKPFIEQKIDKMVVNVDAAVTNAGSTALEILEKSPGITVDKDGNISLKGKAGVRIYIDGRPSYLSGADLANLLKNMQANQLDQLEIMTNPSAKYDAAGNAGVINIKLKKSKMLGFNGSLSSSYTQGMVPRFNESANINFRKNKLNLFANASYSNNRQVQEIVIMRNFRNKDTKELLSIFDQKADLRNHRQNLDMRIGADYSLSKKTTIGALFTGFYNPEKVRNTNNTYLRDKSGTVNALTTATSDMNNKWHNFSGNLNLRHVFDSTGRELTADVDYSIYRSVSKQTLANNYFDASGIKLAPSDTLVGNIPSNINIFSAKVDYTQPVLRNGKLEAGIKASFVKTDNDARYDSLINNVLVPDFGRTNYFVYEEQIQAAYLNLQKPLSKKWDMQLGLRLENTVAKGKQLTTGETFDRNYTQLFPTAYFSYKMNAANTFSINYGRRIERPDYSDLNPFFFFLDRYTYQAGNPRLSPQFSHNIELTHTFKGFLNTTLNYSKTTDMLQDIFEQNEATQETFIKKDNIASGEQFGLAVNAGLQPVKWLSVNVYANVSRNRFQGFVNNADVDLTNTMFTGNVSTQINFGKGWKGSVDGFYRGGGLDGVLAISPLWAANAGISKMVLKNKGTVRVAMRDIFWTQRFKGTAQYAYIDTWFRQWRDSQQVTVGFTYRFGKGKAGASRRKIGGADEEKGRVKAGGN